MDDDRESFGHPSVAVDLFDQVDFRKCDNELVQIEFTERLRGWQGAFMVRSSVKRLFKELLEHQNASGPAAITDFLETQ